MRSRKNLNDELSEFLAYWDVDKTVALLEDLQEIFKLYDVDKEDDWLEKIVGREDVCEVRLARTVYLLSIMAHRWTPVFLRTRAEWPDLWRRIEKQSRSLT